MSQIDVNQIPKKKIVIKGKKIMPREEYEDLYDLFKQEDLKVKLTNITFYPSHRRIIAHGKEVIMYYDVSLHFEIEKEELCLYCRKSFKNEENVAKFLSGYAHIKCFDKKIKEEKEKNEFIKKKFSK